MKICLLSVALLATALLSFEVAPASAEELDPGGTLNPDEMSLNQSLKRAMDGDVNMVICAQGYLMTKKGNHEDARKLFLNCAEKGWTGTMTWMSYMEQNGFGGPEDAEKSAEWDRKAAMLGDPMGEFNYGLNLLRGYGVQADPELGRHYIDRAAEKGLDVADQLIANDYDWQSVTPDADEWKYNRVF